MKKVYIVVFPHKIALVFPRFSTFFAVFRRTWMDAEELLKEKYFFSYFPLCSCPNLQSDNFKPTSISCWLL